MPIRAGSRRIMRPCSIPMTELCSMHTNQPFKRWLTNTVFVADAIGSAATLDCAILEACMGVASLSFTLRQRVSPKEFLPLGFFDYKRIFVSAIDATAHQCSLDTHVGALAHIVSLSHEIGLDNRLPDTLYAVYAAAVAAGLGAKELPAVYELCRAKST